MRRAIAVGALSAVMALGVAGLTSAAIIRIPPVPQLIFTAGGTVSPNGLPKNDHVPVTASIFGKIKTSDGAHPSALREIDVNIDKDVRINARGYPSCEGGQRDLRRNPAVAREACSKAILGSGDANIEIAFPERKPILVNSPITVFNGGEKGGKVKLLIHVFITVPVPAAIVTEVTIKRSGSGIKSVAKVPVAVGGSGSALSFNFKLGKIFSYKGKKVGYFQARCPDGKFKVSVPKIFFKNDAKIPGVAPTTTLKGGLAVPCTAQGPRIH